MGDVRFFYLVFGLLMSSISGVWRGEWNEGEGSGTNVYTGLVSVHMIYERFWWKKESKPVG